MTCLPRIARIDTTPTGELYFTLNRSLSLWRVMERAGGPPLFRARSPAGPGQIPWAISEAASSPFEPRDRPVGSSIPSGDGEPGSFAGTRAIGPTTRHSGGLACTPRTPIRPAGRPRRETPPEPLRRAQAVRGRSRPACTGRRVKCSRFRTSSERTLALLADPHQHRTWSRTSLAPADQDLPHTHPTPTTLPLSSPKTRDPHPHLLPRPPPLSHPPRMSWVTPHPWPDESSVTLS